MTEDHNNEYRAIQEFRMITTSEANIRKKAGAIVASAIAIYQYISPNTLPTGPFTVLVAAAIGTYRTGTCYQWGGILTGKWNLDGMGLTQIPIERGGKYAKFAQQKKKEFGMQLITSLFMGIIFGWVYGVMVRDENFGDVLSETLSWAVGALLVTLLVSVMS